MAAEFPPSFDLGLVPDPSATCEGRLEPDDGGGCTPVFGLSGSGEILTSLSGILMSESLGTENVTSLPSETRRTSLSLPGLGVEGLLPLGLGDLLLLPLPG